MSKPSANTGSKPEEKTSTGDGITWGPWLAVIAVIAVYFLSQFVAAQLASIYPALRHWSSSQATDWITSSVVGQFIFVALAEGLAVLLIWWFVRWRRGDFKAIGLRKPKLLEDGLFALSGLAIYFPAYLILISVISALVPSLNLNQQQQIGFSQASGAGELTLVLFSLVIFPPIAEEILFRGFLYSGLRKKLNKIWAALVVSALFAVPHLLEGNGGGLLWIAGIDTFVLSLVLVWLREKTGRLYAGMGLHALKNFIAFASLFIFHVH